MYVSSLKEHRSVFCLLTEIRTLECPPHNVGQHCTPPSVLIVCHVEATRAPVTSPGLSGAPNFSAATPRRAEATRPLRVHPSPCLRLDHHLTAMFRAAFRASVSTCHHITTLHPKPYHLKFVLAFTTQSDTSSSSPLSRHCEAVYHTRSPPEDPGCRQGDTCCAIYERNTGAASVRLLKSRDTGARAPAGPAGEAADVQRAGGCRAKEQHQGVLVRRIFLIMALLC